MLPSWEVLRVEGWGRERNGGPPGGREVSYDEHLGFRKSKMCLASPMRNKCTLCWETERGDEVGGGLGIKGGREREGKGEQVWHNVRTYITTFINSM